MIKNQCVSCLKKFKNSKHNFKHNANYCLDCSIKCGLKFKWRELKASNHWDNLMERARLGTATKKGKKITIEEVEEKKLKAERELKELTEMILERWGIDMEKDDVYHAREVEYINYLTI